MSSPSVFDVFVVGGGIAGSVLAGVLAAPAMGYSCSRRRRDFGIGCGGRARGRMPWPTRTRWGSNLCSPRPGRWRLPGSGASKTWRARIGGPRTRPTTCPRWVLSSPHPGHGLAWAASQGATPCGPRRRPGSRATADRPSQVAQAEGEEGRYTARLVVGADGKHSMARRWTGGESVCDPEHHRFGGVLVSGLRTEDRDTDNIAKVGLEAVNWFAAGADYTRLYLQMTAPRLREIGADRSFDAIVAFAGGDAGGVAGRRSPGRTDRLLSQQRHLGDVRSPATTWCSSAMRRGRPIPARATARRCCSTTCGP